MNVSPRYFCVLSIITLTSEHILGCVRSCILMLCSSSDPARGEGGPREGHEQHAGPIRRRGHPDEGEPGSGSGGGRQETQSDLGECSEQCREGEEPHAGGKCTYSILMGSKVRHM